MSTVYASYTGTFRIIRETQEDAEIYGMARSALDRMVRDLQSAAPWRGAFTFITKAEQPGQPGISAPHLPRRGPRRLQ